MSDRRIDEDWEELEEKDDAIIGQAFKVSVVAFVALGAVAAGVVWILNRGNEGPPPGEAEVNAPQVAVSEEQVPPLRFTDVTREVGVEFVHDNGAAGDKYLPETMGAGVLVLDHDGNGAPDLLFVNSCAWTASDGSGSTPRLFLNDGAGGFREATAETGLDQVTFYGMGAALLDLDGDGDEDLFFTAVGENRVLLREGDTYRHADLGLGGEQEVWSTCAAPFDMDGDGDLDLYVGNYVRWSPEIDRELEFQLTGIGRAYGPPTSFSGSQPYLYRNDGGGKFTEVAEENGLHVVQAGTDAPVAKTLGIAVTDQDDDGDLDLIVANDTVRNFLYRNDGSGRFTEDGMNVGLAFDRSGKTTGAMGIDVARFRNDETLGIAIGNFANEMSSFYVRRPGTEDFLDDSVVEGIGAASRRVLSFGLVFLDVDLDGRLDLLQANGHLEPEIETVQASQTHEQELQLFWNAGPEAKRNYVLVDAAQAGDLAEPAVGRALATADLDLDGDLDVILTQNGRAARILRNDQELGHHWTRITLSQEGLNPRAIGARVELVAGGKQQVSENAPTKSYLVQQGAELTFGLGSADTIELVRVHWPDGTVDEYTDLSVDRAHVLAKGG